MAEYFLTMKDISKRYTGVQALNKVDFDLCQGEIHCLAGENGSGKSTLVKIISGLIKPDTGTVEIDGKLVHHGSSLSSIQKGIAVIYQDPSLFSTLSVAENIVLNTLIAEGRKLYSRRMVMARARKAIAKIGVHLPLNTPAGELSVADQQLSAICRALSGDVRLLIMDEPTTSLTRKEVVALFAVVLDLKKKGIGTLFISHKLDEVFEIAERVTVLRDGEKIGTYPSKELDEAKLSYLMTGKNIEYPAVPNLRHDARVLLEVQALSKDKEFRDVTFSLHEGEILGITGLLGAGRTELALSLFGLNKPDGGAVFIEGKKTQIKSVEDAISHKIAYVPENRLTQGLIMGQSVGKNIIITVLSRMLNALGLLDKTKNSEFMDKWIKALSIKVTNAQVPVEALSGGNQQRVVLAKWMATEPKILILDGPTVGIDVAAKSDMHALIHSLAMKGVGVIIISDEVSEVYRNCNRVLVMKEGRVTGEFIAGSNTMQDIVDALG